MTGIDITVQTKLEEERRIVAEENEIVIRQSGNSVFRYYIQSDTAVNVIDFGSTFGFQNTIPAFEQALLDKGAIAQESEAAYRVFFDALRAGVKKYSFDMHVRGVKGVFRWYHVDSTTVFSDGNPNYAVVSFCDTLP